MGADRIFMGETSALGRIDPQIVVEDKNRGHYVMPAHVVVKSFDYLVNKTRVPKGNVQSFLQLLSNYDAKEIEFVRRQLRLNEDIALRALQQGMWAEMSEKERKKKIAPFVRPIVTKAHARDIFSDEAQKAGLKIELVCHGDPIWSVVCDYYSLAWDFVTTKHCKLIESTDSHFSLAWQDK